MRAPRVVVADDHPVVRDGLRRSLESFGIEVVGEAADGRAAVAAVETLGPDAVLMDLSMPGRDGISATGIVKTRHPAVAVVVLTFDSDPETHRRAVGAGASVVVTKDAPAEEVVAALLGAVNGKSGERRRGAGAGEAREVDTSFTLTAREVEVLALITRGATTNRVGSELAISVKTVKNHLASIYEKLDVTDRTQAVLSALRLGLVSLD